MSSLWICKYLKYDYNLKKNPIWEGKLLRQHFSVYSVLYLCKINSFLRLFLFQVLDIFSEQTHWVRMVGRMPKPCYAAGPPGPCCLSAPLSQSELKPEVPGALLWELGGHFSLEIAMSILQSIRNSGLITIFGLKHF